MRIVKFKCFDEFHCIGSECSDCCCEGCNIALNKKEYLDLKNAKCSPHLKAAADNAFVMTNNGKPGGDVYAYIKPDEKGNCPFYDSDKLCMIQKELGERALCYTCAAFPRLIAGVGSDDFVCSCDVSCPRVNEILINHAEGLEIAEEEYNGGDSYLNTGLFSSEFTNENRTDCPYFWTIKNAEIDILQNRSFTISERLLILGFFCKKADEYIANKQGEKIQALYNMILDVDFCRKIAESLKVSPNDKNSVKKPLEIFQNFYFLCNNAANANSKALSLFKKAADSISLNVNTKKGIRFSYNSSKYYYYLGIFRGIEFDRPYIFENLLLNLAFIQTPSSGLFKNFFTLALFYNTLKICLPVFLEKGRTDKDLALAIAYSAKMVLNSHYAENEVTKAFKANDFYDLPHAAFLVC